MKIIIYTEEGGVTNRYAISLRFTLYFDQDKTRQTEKKQELNV